MKSRMVTNQRLWKSALTSIITIACVGCTVSTHDNQNGNANNHEPPPDDQPGLNSVRIQFRNLGTNAVDTQFYAADGPFDQLPDDLIVPENLIQAGIGVGGTGILAPFSSDEIELPCSDQLVVGTAGGEFMDADLGNPLGNGPVRFMQAGFQFDCGATLVLEYSQTLGGFTVNLFQENAPQ
jgi:hypothetical protein